jgi:hypothetical protein
MSIGQDEDTKAFRAMLTEAHTEVERLYKEAKEEHGVADKRTAHLRMLRIFMCIVEGVLRFAFDAGMERGEEKHGLPLCPHPDCACCEAQRNA